MLVCLGTPLLEQMEKSFGRHHDGVERQESAQAKAQRLLCEEFERRGWSERDLKRFSKDAQKVQIASRLRQETTMTWEWIARNLPMGASAYAANCVRLYKMHSNMRLCGTDLGLTPL